MVEAEVRFYDTPVCFQRNVRVVVILRQMSEAGPLQPIAGGPEQLGSFDIREMPSGAFYAALKKSRVGAAVEHLRVVIAFDEDSVKGRNETVESLKGMTEVGQYSETLLTCGDDEGRPFGAVMRRGDRMNGNGAVSQSRAGLEMPNHVQSAEIMPFRSDIESLWRHVNRDAVFPLVNARISYMVGMIMGYDQSVDIPDFPAVFYESAFCLCPADTGVEEKLYAAGLDVNAVAVAS